MILQQRLQVSKAGSKAQLGRRPVAVVGGGGYRAPPANLLYTLATRLFCCSCLPTAIPAAGCTTYVRTWQRLQRGGAGIRRRHRATAQPAAEAVSLWCERWLHSVRNHLTRAACLRFAPHVASSCPRVRDLRLYDVANTAGVAADLSHIATAARVSAHTGGDELPDALYGADLVVIPAGVPRKPGMTRDDLFNINAGACRQWMHTAQTLEWADVCDEWLASCPSAAFVHPLPC